MGSCRGPRGGESSAARKRRVAARVATSVHWHSATRQGACRHCHICCSWQLQEDGPPDWLSDLQTDQPGPERRLTSIRCSLCLAVCGGALHVCIAVTPPNILFQQAFGSAKYLASHGSSLIATMAYNHRRQSVGSTATRLELPASHATHPCILFAADAPIKANQA